MLGLGTFSFLGSRQERAVRGRSCSAWMPRPSGSFLPKASTLGSSCGENSPAADFIFYKWAGVHSHGAILLGLVGHPQLSVHP